MTFRLPDLDVILACELDCGFDRFGTPRNQVNPVE
jgi:hypothetical protein